MSKPPDLKLVVSKPADWKPEAQKRQELALPARRPIQVDIPAPINLSFSIGDLMFGAGVVVLLAACLRQMLS
jgi:hypothetical protein